MPRNSTFFAILWLGFLICEELIHLALPTAFALDNGLAQVPPMGWNHWNAFSCGITEQRVLDTASKLKEFGLDQLGYVYVNLDDCWSEMQRTKDGTLTGDHRRFPHNMKWLGHHLHGMGLKFGIYSSAGTETCAGYPASLHKEAVDAQTFADWGVDYLKYDNCHNLGLHSVDRFVAMRNALNATGRPILYSICQWGHESPWQWAPSVGHSWRADGDMHANWRAIKHSFHTTMEHFERAGPGVWLDPDMLQVGCGDLNLEENQSHFALWALIKAPLLLGNNLMEMSDQVLQIISNPHLIAWHQDPNTPVATRFHGRAHFDNGEDEYAVYAASRRKGSNDDNDHDGVIEEMTAIVVNWGEFSEPAHTLDVTQILGLTPFPGQEVYVKNLYTGGLVKPVNASSAANGYYEFTYTDLKAVPVPELLKHASIVYQFTVCSSNSPCSQRTRNNAVSDEFNNTVSSS